MIPILEQETFDKVSSKSSLIEMNRDQQRTESPRKVNTKEPVDYAYKIDLAALSEKSTEKSFHLRIFQKVDKIINIYPKGERISRLCGQKVGRIDNETQVKAGVFEWRSLTNRTKDCIYLVVPMARAPA